MYCILPGTWGRKCLITTRSEGLNIPGGEPPPQLSAYVLSRRSQEKCHLGSLRRLAVDSSRSVSGTGRAIDRCGHSPTALGIRLRNCAGVSADLHLRTHPCRGISSAPAKMNSSLSSIVVNFAHEKRQKVRCLPPNPLRTRLRQCGEIRR